MTELSLTSASNNDDNLEEVNTLEKEIEQL